MWNSLQEYSLVGNDRYGEINVCYQKQKVDAIGNASPRPFGTFRRVSTSYTLVGCIRAQFPWQLREIYDCTATVMLWHSLGTATRRQWLVLSFTKSTLEGGGGGRRRLQRRGHVSGKLCAAFLFPLFFFRHSFLKVAFVAFRASARVSMASRLLRYDSLYDARNGNVGNPPFPWIFDKRKRLWQQSTRRITILIYNIISCKEHLWPAWAFKVDNLLKVSGEILKQPLICVCLERNSEWKKCATLFATLIQFSLFIRAWNYGFWNLSNGIRRKWNGRVRKVEWEGGGVRFSCELEFSRRQRDCFLCVIKFIKNKGRCPSF